MPEAQRDEIAKLEALYAANPEGHVFTHLAEAYRKVGELDHAHGILTEGLRRHPDSASAHVVLGRLEHDRDDPEAARAAFTRVLQLDHDNLIALRFLGELALQRGDRGEALARFRELLGREVSDPAIQQTVEELSRHAESAVELEQVEAESAAELEPVEAESSPEPEPVEAESAAEREPVEAESAAEREPVEAEAAAEREPVEEAPEPVAAAAEPMGAEPEAPEAAAEPATGPEAAVAIAPEAEGSEPEPEPAESRVEASIGFEQAAAGIGGTEPGEDGLEMVAESLNPDADVTEAEPASAEAVLPAATGEAEGVSDAAEPVPGDAEPELESVAFGDYRVDEAPGPEFVQLADELTESAESEFLGLEIVDSVEGVDLEYLSLEEDDAVESAMAFTALGPESVVDDIEEPDFLAPWLEAEVSPELDVGDERVDLASAEAPAPEVLWASPPPEAPVGEPSAAEPSAVEAPVGEPSAAEPVVEAPAAELAGAQIGPSVEAEQVAAEADLVIRGAFEPPAEVIPPLAELTVLGDLSRESESEEMVSAGAAWAIDEAVPGLYTETMAELYRSQGFADRAAEVYRWLLSREPENERLRLLVDEVEAERATAAVRSPVEPGRGRRDWTVDTVEAAFTGAAGVAAGGESPYAWSDAGEEGLPAGPSAGDYFRQLLSWRPAAPAEELAVSGSELLLDEVVVEPPAAAAAEAGSTGDLMPWEFAEPPALAVPAEAELASEEPARSMAELAPEEDEAPVEVEVEDEDLEMFRSWLQSLKK